MAKRNLWFYLVALLVFSIGLSGCGLTLGTSKIEQGRPQDLVFEIPATDKELPPHVTGQIMVLARNDSMDSIAAAINGTLVSSIAGRSIHLFDLPEGVAITDALRSLAHHTDVLVAEPNLLFSKEPLPFDLELLSELDHPGRLYGLDAIQAPIAWAAGYTGKGVVVAILDTGIDATHQEWRDGQIIGGINFTMNKNVIDHDYWHDVQGHGSHVAGTVAGPNVGVARDAELLAVKVLSDTGSSTGFSVAEGLFFVESYAAQNPDKKLVVNMSLGGAGFSPVNLWAVQEVLQAGIPIVVSMGNTGNHGLRWPAAYPGVIAVGAIDGREQKARFSTTGDHISVTAPGVNIWSTYRGSYAYLQGTSMSAPHVAGAVAILRQARPDASPTEIKQILEQSSTDLGAPGFDRKHGHGLINLAKALDIETENVYGNVSVTVNVTGVPLDTLYRVELALETPEGKPLPPAMIFDETNTAVFYDIQAGQGYELTVAVRTLDEDRPWIVVQTLYVVSSAVDVVAGETTEVTIDITIE